MVRNKLKVQNVQVAFFHLFKVDEKVDILTLVNYFIK